MSIGRVFLIFTVTLFTMIGIAAWIKGGKRRVPLAQAVQQPSPLEIDLQLNNDLCLVETKPSAPSLQQPPTETNESEPRVVEEARAFPLPSDGLPEGNRVEEFFRIRDPKFSFVQTLTYHSKVDWLSGRPAWLTDYSSHFKTSRHFIARSLHGKPDYFKQDIGEGDRFNTLHPDRDLSFYLLIDLSRCKMWFYVLDHTAHERTLIKTYDVGLGRFDPDKPSGLLTPTGKYQLGEKIAVYKSKVFGHYNGERTEMIRVFGTRWIPFEKELGGTTVPAKGFGIHGSPWATDESGDDYCDNSGIGKYESDGCIRLRMEDIEELFSIVISRSTTIELVRDFADVQLPVA